MSRLERGVPNAVFTGIIQEIKPSDLGLAHSQIFPRVAFRSDGNGRGYYRTYDLGESLKLVDENALVRRPGVPANKLNRGRELGFFQVKRRHLDAVVSDDEAKVVAQQSLGGEDLHASETRWVRELMLLAKEREAAALASSAGAVGGSSSPATTWDASNSSPTKDITDAMLQVRNQSGMYANCMAVSFPVAVALMAHPEIQAKRSANERKVLTTEALAELLRDVFGLKRVVVINSQYVPSRAEGSPVSLVDLWGDRALFWYEGSNPGFFQPTWAVEAVDTFYYNGQEMGVYDIRDEDAEATYHRVKEDYAFVVLNKELAFRLDNVLGLDNALGSDDALLIQ